MSAPTHDRIASVVDYRFFLAADATSLNIPRSGLIRLKAWLWHPIWRFQRRLRRAEYWHNCRRHTPWGRIITFFHKRRLAATAERLGFQVPINTCGPGLAIAHFGCLIINSGARIGRDCRIHAMVNIGTEAGKTNAAPTIGDRVYIGPGAVLFGPITIADDCVIGANAVVNKSFTTPGQTLAGVPATVISRKGPSGLLTCGAQQTAEALKVTGAFSPQASARPPALIPDHPAAP